MSTVRVKRPKIRSSAVSSCSGKSISKRVPLVSPFHHPVPTTSHQSPTVHDVPHVPFAVDELFESVPKCGWEELRPELYRVFYESKAQDEVECCICSRHMTERFIRCEDCGPFAFYCEACCNSTHGGQSISSHHQLLFHKPKIWTVSTKSYKHVLTILWRGIGKALCHVQSMFSSLIWIIICRVINGHSLLNFIGGSISQNSCLIVLQNVIPACTIYYCVV